MSASCLGVRLLLVLPLHLRIAVDYVVPFAAYFLVLEVYSTASCGLPDARRPCRARCCATPPLPGAGSCCSSFQYIPLLDGGTLALPEQALLTIVAFQLLNGRMGEWL